MVNYIMLIYIMYVDVCVYVMYVYYITSSAESTATAGGQIVCLHHLPKMLTFLGTKAIQ